MTAPQTLTLLPGVVLRRSVRLPIDPTGWALSWVIRPYAGAAPVHEAELTPTLIYTDARVTGAVVTLELFEAVTASLGTSLHPSAVWELLGVEPSGSLTQVFAFGPVVPRPRGSAATHEGVIALAAIGPQGPPGASGTSYLAYPAAAPLGGHRAVSVRAGSAFYADHRAAQTAGRVVGVTAGAVAVGADAQIQVAGPLSEPSWSWATDTPIYLGEDGLLTQTPPATGVLVVVGYPLTTTAMMIQPGFPVLIGD